MLNIFRSPLNKSLYFVCEVNEKGKIISQVTDEMFLDLAQEFVDSFELVEDGNE